jgi:hypothetical protein
LLWLKERKRSYRSVLELDSQFVSFNANEEDIVEDLVEMEKNKLVWKHFRELNEECKKIIQLAIDRTPLGLITEIMGFSSVQYTKNRKTSCKNNLVKKIRNSPEFKELRNETIRESTAIPRW